VLHQVARDAVARWVDGVGRSAAAGGARVAVVAGHPAAAGRLADLRAAAEVDAQARAAGRAPAAWDAALTAAAGGIQAAPRLPVTR
jgi:hypothetical protein